MLGRAYWLGVISVIGFSFVFWFFGFSWLGVTDPVPGAAICSAICLTGYLIFARILLVDEPSHEIPSKTTHGKA